MSFKIIKFKNTLVNQWFKAIRTVVTNFKRDWLTCKCAFCSHDQGLRLSFTTKC